MIFQELDDAAPTPTGANSTRAIVPSFHWSGDDLRVTPRGSAIRRSAIQQSSGKRSLITLVLSAIGAGHQA